MKTKNKLIKKSKINISMYIIVIILICLAILIKTYIIDLDNTSHNKKLAIEKCKNLCILENAKQSLPIEGPCLNSKVVAGWGCDIINSPRMSIYDDKKENQCEANKHLVELTKNCKLIKAI